MSYIVRFQSSISEYLVKVCLRKQNLFINLKFIYLLHRRILKVDFVLNNMSQEDDSDKLLYFSKTAILYFIVNYKPEKILYFLFKTVTLFKFLWVPKEIHSRRKCTR